MYPIKPSLMMFYSILLLSTLTALSSSNWLIFWVAMEINLLAFIPLIQKDKTSSQMEASVKYFLAQAIGSAFILVSAVATYTASNPIISNLNSLILILGLIMKLGFPPLHYWMPQVMQGLSWINCAILNTWQKLAPLLALLTLCSKSLSPSSMTVLAFGAIVGSLGGINQSKIRSMLAFSSMSHMSWMLATSFISITASQIYLLTYILISLSIMWSMHTLESSSYDSISSMKINNPFQTWSVLIMMLSLGGLPPLLGFFPKWMAMESLLATGSSLFVLALLMSALINLFFYLRLSFNLSLAPNHSSPLSFPAPSQLALLASATLPAMPFLMYTLLYAMNLLNEP